MSLFLSLAIEPGVNRLARRGWRRGSATALIELGVFVVAMAFIASIGTLVFRQTADLLDNSEQYVNRTVDLPDAPELRNFARVLRKSPALRWLQIHPAGAELPIYRELRERGVIAT